MHPLDALDVLAYLRTNHEQDIDIDAYVTYLLMPLPILGLAFGTTVSAGKAGSMIAMGRSTLDFKITLKAYIVHIDSIWPQASQFHPSCNHSSWRQEGIPYPLV